MPLSLSVFLSQVGTSCTTSSQFFSLSCYYALEQERVQLVVPAKLHDLQYAYK